MRFIEAEAAGTRRLRIPRLDGGLNLRAKPHRIADNQLAACENLWWRDGALRPRPGVCRGGSACRPEAGSDVRRLAGREDVTLEENGGRRTLRRFVERTRLSGTTAAYAVGALYRDGGTAYSRMLTLSGTETGPLANSHGLAVDTAEGASHRLLVFFGCGRVYTVENGGWRDLGGEVYIPRLLFAGKGTASPSNPPPEDGIQLESRNLLTPKFRALYTTDGKSAAFFLPQRNLDRAEVRIRLTGPGGAAVNHDIAANAAGSAVASDGYGARINRDTGCVTFVNGADIPQFPPYTSVNNLEITASKTDMAGLDRICGMTFHAWFSSNPGGSQAGARLFLGGNTRYPHLVHWSAFGNPLYFPEYNYSFVGRADEALTGFGHQGDALVLFKERSIYGVDYVLRPMSDKQDTTDLTASAAYFPVTRIVGGVGCDAPGTIAVSGEKLLWAFGGRVYVLTSVDAAGRGCVRALSGPVENALGAHPAAAWRGACAGFYGGCYLLLAENTLYLLQAEEPLLLRFNRATTDEQAEKQLRWSRWTVDGTVRPLLLTAGEEDAALLGLVTWSGAPAAAEFRLYGETDTVFPSSGEREEAVHWRVATKEYDFDCPERGKAILSVRAGLSADNRRPVRFSYVTQAGECAETVEVPPDGGWLRRLPGCTRARRFGIRLEGDGSAELDGLAVYYRMQG